MGCCAGQSTAFGVPKAVFLDTCSEGRSEFNKCPISDNGHRPSGSAPLEDRAPEQGRKDLPLSTPFSGSWAVFRLGEQ